MVWEKARCKRGRGMSDGDEGLVYEVLKII